MGGKGEIGRRGRGKEGRKGILPVVPCSHLFSPVAARCHSLSPVVTRYYPLSPVGTQCHPLPLVDTRYYPLSPAVTCRQPLSTVVRLVTRRRWHVLRVVLGASCFPGFLPPLLGGVDGTSCVLSWIFLLS